MESYALLATVSSSSSRLSSRESASISSGIYSIAVLRTEVTPIAAARRRTFRWPPLCKVWICQTDSIAAMPHPASAACCRSEYPKMSSILHCTSSQHGTAHRDQFLRVARLFSPVQNESHVVTGAKEGNREGPARVCTAYGTNENSPLILVRSAGCGCECRPSI
jgi:hypothetical protein